jgi:hypothetical protein
VSFLFYKKKNRFDGINRDKLLGSTFKRLSGNRLLKKRTQNTIIYFAHAHCYSKLIMRHNSAVAMDLEFVEKDKRNSEKI